MIDFEQVKRDAAAKAERAAISDAIRDAYAAERRAHHARPFADRMREAQRKPHQWWREDTVYDDSRTYDVTTHKDSTR